MKPGSLPLSSSALRALPSLGRRAAMSGPAGIVSELQGSANIRELRKPQRALQSLRLDHGWGVHRG